MLQLAGLVASVSVVCLASAQSFESKALPSTHCECGWPPRVRDLVNIDSLNDPAANQFGQVALQPGATHTIYTVPAGKSLVVTSFAIGTEYWALQEITGGGAIWKTSLSGASFNYSGGPGVKFSPGAAVAIYNGLGGYERQTTYKLVGYLAE